MGRDWKRRSPERKRKRRQRPFDFLALRRSEIERIAGAIGRATRRCLFAWAQHYPGPRDRVAYLIAAAGRMNRSISAAEACAVLDQADDMHMIRKADALAKYLGVTLALRQRLHLRTIGATDLPKRARSGLRKQKAKERDEKRRRLSGAKPHAESLARAKPWEAEGICRRTWYYRRRKAAIAHIAQIPAQSLLLSSAQESVQPSPRHARKAGLPKG
jgi:hypothetical protein